MRILDSVHPDGAKLIEMRPDDLMKLRTAQPGVRVVPEIFFRAARARGRGHSRWPPPRAGR